MKAHPFPKPSSLLFDYATMMICLFTYPVCTHYTVLTKYALTMQYMAHVELISPYMHAMSR